MWVYKSIKEGSHWLFTVGWTDPEGRWNSDSDHDSRENAAARCNYLNGGIDESRLQEIRNAILEVAAGVQARRIP